METPNDFQKRSLWVGITSFSLFVTSAVIIFSIWILGKALGFLSPVLVPLAVSAIFAFLLDPVVRWFQRRKVPRTRAIIAVLSLVFVAISLVNIIIIPKAVEDIRQITDQENRQTLVNKITDRFEKVRNNPVFRPVVAWLAEEPTGASSDDEESLEIPPELPEPALPGEPDPESSGEEVQPIEEIDWKKSRLIYFLQGKADVIGSKILETLRAGSNTVIGLIGTLFGIVMIPIFTFYFLRDSESIKESWHEYLPLRASRFKTEIVETLREINSYLIAFFRGQVVVSIINGILTGIALKLLGLPYAITIGLALAVLGVMPFFGIIFTYIPAALIALGHFGDWQHVLYVTLIFAGIQQLEGLVIQPKIVGESVGLHPLTVIFSVLFWTLLLGGIIGALLAVPLTAAVKVLFRRYIWQLKIKPHTQLDDGTAARFE